MKNQKASRETSIIAKDEKSVYTVAAYKLQVHCSFNCLLQSGPAELI